MTSGVSRPSWWNQRRPGELVRVALGDTEVAVTLFVATGVRPGPTLAVLGAVHGNEYEGPVTIANLLATLDSAVLAGTLIAVPVANPPAYMAGTRTSPLDGLNLARTFPGNSVGTASERLAWLLAEEVIGVADALIDLHSGGGASDMALLVGYPALGDAASRRSRELAIAFGAPVIWEHPEVSPGRTLLGRLRSGIPCLYTEAGGGGIAPEEVVRCYLEGVQRVMIALGMLAWHARTAPARAGLARRGRHRQGPAGDRRGPLPQLRQGWRSRRSGRAPGGDCLPRRAGQRADCGE